MGVVAEIIEFCFGTSLASDTEIEMEDMRAIRYRKDKASYLDTINKASGESAEIGGADVSVTFERAERQAKAEDWDLASELLGDAHRKAALVLKRKPFLTAKIANEPKINAAIKIKTVNPQTKEKYGDEVKAKWKEVVDFAKKDDVDNALQGIMALVHTIDVEITPTLKKARDDNATKLLELKEDLEKAKGNPEELRKIAIQIIKNTGDAEDLGVDPGENSRKPFTEEKGGAWTAKNCEDTFVAYDWFALKKCRKDKRIKLAGRDRDFSDDDMWKLVQYRGKAVNEEIDKLRKKYPTLIASASGSEDIESDIDIAFATPGSGNNVKAAQEFNTAIKKRFKKPPGRVFDVNIYPRDYRPLKGDSFKPSYTVEALEDEGIDEPEQVESLKLSMIDQDVATLLKQRRFLDEGKFNEMLQTLMDKAPDDATKKRIEKQYEEGEDIYLLTSIEKIEKIRAQAKVDEKSTDKHAANLKRDLDEFDKIKRKGDKASMIQAQKLAPRILDQFEETFPDESMDVTDALYLEKMGALREDQESIRTLKEDDDPDEHHPGKPCEEAHKGLEHDTWVQKELNALEVKVKKDMFTNIIFANEAIMSQGALNHVVGAMQAKTDDAKKEAADKLSASDLMQSVNEQVADLFKEMKHYEGVVKEAEETAGGNAEQKSAKNQATGEGYVHASKYFFRLLNAAILLNLKYPKETYPQIHDPYEAVNNQPLVELEKRVNDVLLKLRKSAVIPPEVKGEVGALEMQEIFTRVKDIPSFRTMISDFAIELNKRIRSLEEFKLSQEMNEKSEREAEQAYFQAAAPNEAEPGSKEDAENQIRIILNKPLVANPKLADHLKKAGVADGAAITALWTAAISALGTYKDGPNQSNLEAARQPLTKFAAAIGKVDSEDIKAALLEARDGLAEKLEILELANGNQGEFKTIETDFEAAEKESANAETYQVLDQVRMNKRLDETQSRILAEAEARLRAVAEKLGFYDGKNLPKAVARRRTLLADSLKTRLESVAKCLKM